ncbi:MAG: hypothetical protein IT506_07980 [Aquabacterium sp.]|nr:hypothetical protein [Aquabacterium sp.]
MLTPWAVLVLLACTLSGLMPQARAATPTAAIQTYFNQRAGISYTEPYRQLIRPGDDFENKIVNELNQARVSIELANTALTLPHIGQALASAQQRGVKVRVILDNAYNRDWAALEPDEVASLSDEDQALWAEVDNLIDTDHDGDLSEAELAANDIPTLLRQNSIPVIDDTEDGSKGSGIMHHKFVVIDGKRVIVASVNFTHSGFYGDIGTAGSLGNIENMVVLSSPELAALYQEEFAAMWGDGPGGTRNSLFGLNKPYRPLRQATVGNQLAQVQFGPTSERRPLSDSPAGSVIRLIAQSNTAIQIAMYVLTDQAVTDALQAAYGRKPLLRLEALFDRSFASNNYNASLDMWGIRQLDAACQLQPYSHPWLRLPQAVGVPQTPQGDKLHHKFAILDSQIVLTGSYNWTTAGLRTNDENLLVIRSPEVAADYAQEMGRLLQGATFGTPATVASKARADAARCPQ